MPTIRRSGSAPADPQAPNASPPEAGAPGEHSLSHLGVPGDTTPTWELEMLVSGAVLVGLFQLPPVLDGVLRPLLPRLTSNFAVFGAGIAYAYVKGMVYALMVAFVLHLASRAYWVALVGLDSVFPHGVRWENARKMGPIARELIRERMPSLPRVISALDNFCSVLFAVGFATVSMGAVSLTVFSLAGAITWGVATFFLHGSRPDGILPVVAALLMAPLFLLRFDRGWGDRLARSKRATALVRGILRYTPYVLAMRLYGPLYLTLITNLRRRVAIPLLLALLLGSMGFAFADMLALRGKNAGALYPDLPEALRGRAADYRHYADQRNGGDAFTPVPFIQSDVIRDPYVRLFIPYRPAQDVRELTACMQAPATGVARGNPALAALPASLALRCLAAMHAVSLDGRARTDFDYRFYTDAASGLQGLLVYIPVEGLARGRNLITVRRPAQLDDDNRLQPATADSIPFWL